MGLFKLEEINGHGMCPTYLYRWTLLRVGGFAAYLHHFVGDDWSLDHHDHPKRFVSIGLWGGYDEHTPKGTRHYQAPWIRSFPPEHTHRLTLRPGTDCWTLVIVGRRARDWGFWHGGRWIQWLKYVTDRGLTSKAKSCPD